MQFITHSGLTPYSHAVEVMEACAKNIRAGDGVEQVWLLEHPPLFTKGFRTHKNDITDTLDFPVYATNRGGKLTYHGPGQRICYVMCDLNKRGRDLRKHIHNLQEWGAQTLTHFGVESSPSEQGVGLWVKTPGGLFKIAAIGVRVSGWITSHGIAFNLSPDLSHYQGIVPCGIVGAGVTSMQKLGCDVNMEEFDLVLKKKFEEVF